MFLGTFVLLFPLSLQQEPSRGIQRGLASSDPGYRLASARDLATLGGEVSKWLKKQSGKGSPERKRALLLATVLMGGDESWAILEKAARRGRRPTSERAWALFLYGAFHPEAGVDLKKDGNRPASDFERSCLLAGLLAQAPSLDEKGVRTLMGRKPGPRTRALAGLLQGLGGGPLPPLAPEMALQASRLMASIFPGQSSLTRPLVGDQGKALPRLWREAALRSPPRDLETLRLLIAEGQGGAASLALYEVEADLREPLFGLLNTRLAGADEKAWTWGAAGELKMNLPDEDEEVLDDLEVVGLVSLARVDLAAAETAGKGRLAGARARLVEGRNLEEDWTAAWILALSGGPDDLELLRLRLEKATGPDRALLHPIWQFACRSLGDETARKNWLSKWARSLGAGRRGFLDREGPRFVAWMLVARTETAEQKAELAGLPEDRSLKRPEHSPGDDLYADLAGLLLSDLYRWDLP